MSTCKENGPRTDGKVDLDLPTSGRINADAIQNSAGRINMNPTNIQMPNVSGEQLFSALQGANNFNGNIGDNRIVYRGPDLGVENRDKLISYLSGEGYRYKRMRDSRNRGEVDVWVKQ